MNFREIPQFPRAVYSIDVDLSYLQESIGRYEHNYNLDMNPWFQRGHVWTEAQQVAFLEYFLRGGFSGKDIFFNCPGWHDTYDGDMVLVDGLQRLTAILSFLRGEIKAFGQTVDEFGSLLTCQNTLKFHINNLREEKEWVQWYIDFNAGGTPHSEAEIQRVQERLAAL